jgi:uncharacterized protein
VTGRRTVAFGGNSVSEHFNDPRDFRGMLEHREGPETCNTYNMLRLTEQLFRMEPRAAYADFYERALYNHILPSIHPRVPGYVYFTPIRPAHYRVYSQPEQAFWCCVGSGMENPGQYGAFIYTQSEDDLTVNLFIPSEVTVTHLGLRLRQETTFPYEPRTRLLLQLEQPTTFTLRLRHPGWVAAGDFTVLVNGERVSVDSEPASYVEVGASGVPAIVSISSCPCAPLWNGCLMARTGWPCCMARWCWSHRPAPTIWSDCAPMTRAWAMSPTGRWFRWIKRPF